jgi:hypothetical protein
VADYLREHKFAFSADSGVRAAEQLPLPRLPQIALLRPGSVLAFPGGPNRVSVIEVLASESQPIDDKKAAPAIEQYLGNRKREEIATEEVKRLRDASKVEYVGEFAKYASAAPIPAAVADKAAVSDKDKGIAALH